jgi:hypothetical protein
MKRSPVQLRAQALLPLLYHTVLVEEMRVLKQGELYLSNLRASLCHVLRAKWQLFIMVWELSEHIYLPVSLYGDPVIFAPTKRLHFMYVDDAIDHLTELIHQTPSTTPIE